MSDRILNRAQRPAPTRVVAKLRTIDETAELFNTSTRTVRRLGFESRQLSKECPSMTSIRKKLPAKFFARHVGCEVRQGLCGR
jgi:hypothetical protein